MKSVGNRSECAVAMGRCLTDASIATALRELMDPHSASALQRRMDDEYQKDSPDECASDIIDSQQISTIRHSKPTNQRSGVTWPFNFRALCLVLVHENFRGVDRFCKRKPLNHVYWCCQMDSNITNILQQHIHFYSMAAPIELSQQCSRVNFAYPPYFGRFTITHFLLFSSFNLPLICKTCWSSGIKVESYG